MQEAALSPDSVVLKILTQKSVHGLENLVRLYLACLRPDNFSRPPAWSKTSPQAVAFPIVQRIICRQWNLSPRDVVPQANLVRDLGADPVGLVETAMELEEEFGLAISDEQLERLETVQDMVSYICAPQ